MATLREKLAQAKADIIKLQTELEAAEVSRDSTRFNLRFLLEADLRFKKDEVGGRTIYVALTASGKYLAAGTNKEEALERAELRAHDDRELLDNPSMKW